MLTALVVTIIILLILAGVSIMTLAGDNGLLTRTVGAKNKIESAASEEKVEKGTALKINFTASIEGGTITSISPEVPYTTNGTEKSKTFTITGSADGESYSIEYTVQLSEYYAETDPEAGKTTKSKNRTLVGKTDTTLMTYKNPVIPQGFSAIDTTDAKWEYTDETTLNEIKDWNKGLVIQDDSNNQFVWVPCTTGTSSEVVTYSKKYDYPTYFYLYLDLENTAD